MSSDQTLLESPIRSSNVKYATLILFVLFLATGLLWSSVVGSKSRLKIPGPHGLPLFGSLFDVSRSASYPVLLLSLVGEALSDE